jgi:penicillin-binding protein 1A
MVPTMKGVAPRGFALPLAPVPDPNALAEPTDENVETLPVDPLDLPTGGDAMPVPITPTTDAQPAAATPARTAPETRSLDEIVKDVQARPAEASGPPR